MTIAPITDRSGRVLQIRGLTTRAEILECLKDLLNNIPLHHIKVKDITQIVGTSPATFYQHFTDLDGALAALVPEEYSAEGKMDIWEVQLQNWEAINYLFKLRNIHN